MADHKQGRPPALTGPARRRAEAWLAADPDADTRSELEALLSGDRVDLERRFEGRLAFGTAGIRGRMGAGPLRMNRVLVRIVAAALAERVLQEREERPMVVVGYDARHRSRRFAIDAARVLVARGIRATVLPRPMPTPVLAFAVKHLDASAGVMVTASHNPRSDNGCKVYWRGGQQLAAPIDTEIGQIIDRTAPLAEAYLASDDDIGIETAGDELAEAYLASDDDIGIETAGDELAEAYLASDDDIGIETAGDELAEAYLASDDDIGIETAGDELAEAYLASDDDIGIETAGDELAEAYLDAVAGLLSPGGPRSVRMAYTPLHGVGAETFLRALSRAGFDPPAVVAEQAEPDPDFVTAPFPNPEETGVVDRLLDLAAHTGADVALAHDPDADRLAVAVPDAGRWRLLTGDETGCLLAEHLLRRAGPDDGPEPGTGRRRLVINTVVSSRLLPLIAAAHGADWAETLTGFKWILSAHAQRADSHDLVLGYEEALGYAVGEVVRDKDGIGAALVMAELVAALKREGRTLGDLLDDLHRRHGVHATGQRSVRFESVTGNRQPMKMAMAALRDAPPTELGGAAVTAVHDLAAGGSHLPPADVVVLELFGIEARVIVRPSGTEPKMKVYAEAVVVLGDGDDANSGTRLRSARGEARTRIAALLDAAVRHVADPERHGRGRALAASAGAGTGNAETGDPETGDAAARIATGTGDTAARIATGTGDTAARIATADETRVDDLRLVVRCTDLTTLEGDDTPGRIRALCSQALRPDPGDPTLGPVAAVCVHPSLAGLAAELLAGTPVAVASVAGAFPSGLSPLEVKVAEVRAAVAAGAQEIDTVLNRSAFLSGRADLAAGELRALREAAGAAHFKVILEVCELGSAGAIAEATRLAIDAGADMVKTSTGKGSAGASPQAVLTMAETVAEHCAAGGRPVGIKVAGGVRTAADAVAYLDIVRSVLGDDWLTPERLRFGASSLLGNVVAELAGSTAG